MVGNEHNISTYKEKNTGEKNAGEDNNKKYSFVTNLDLDRHRTKDERKSTSPSQASTLMVQFQDVDHNDSISTDTKEKPLPPIPDGGWGWVVVAAAFLTSACSDGLAYSFGNLHEEFIHYFGQSQAKTSWIGSLFIAVPLISGPIMSALVDQYGCRAMTMAASLIATGGFMLAAISNSVELLCLTLGIISGLAMGILYVTSVVAVAFWFDKRRTLAVSLASCGIGFGTVIYGPMTEYFLRNYNWRGTLVLLSCTVLNMCVCGALMRDPDWVIIKDKKEKKRKEAKKARLKKSPSFASISVKSMGGESVVLGLDELNDLIKSGQSPDYILSILMSAVTESEELDTITQMNVEIAHKRNNSTVDLPTFIHQNEQVPPEVMEKIMSNKNLCNIIIDNYPHLMTRRRSEVKFGIGDSSNRNSNDSGLHPPSMKTIKAESEDLSNFDYDERSTGVVIDNRAFVPEEEESKNVVRDINNNLVQMEESKPEILKSDALVYRNPVVYRRALMNVPQHRLRCASLPDIYKNSTSSVLSKSENEKKWYDSVMKMLRKNFNFFLFTEFHFLMFNITSVLMSIWSIIPFFFLKSFMSDVDSGDYSIIIITIGISSGVGIVGLGWFGDKPWFNVTKAYAVCLFICGISVAAYPFVIEDMALLTVVSVVFGVSFASSYSYTPAILMELVPIEHFTVGYGMILLSQGIGNLIGPPIGGLIYDVSESWDLTFFVGGAWLVISGVCVGTIAYTKNRRMRGKEPLLKDGPQKDPVGPNNV